MLAVVAGVMLSYAQHHGSLWLAIALIAIIDGGLAALLRWYYRRM